MRQKILIGDLKRNLASSWNTTKKTTSDYTVMEIGQQSLMGLPEHPYEALQNY